MSGRKSTSKILLALKKLARNYGISSRGKMSELLERFVDEGIFSAKKLKKNKLTLGAVNLMLRDDSKSKSKSKSSKKKSSRSKSKSSKKKSSRSTKSSKSKSKSSKKKSSRSTKSSKSKSKSSRKKKKSSRSTKVKIPIKKGGLSYSKNGKVFSYKIKDSVNKRRKILRDLISRGADALSIFRRLNALATLNKSRQSNSKVLKSDRDYIKKKYYGKKEWNK